MADLTFVVALVVAAVLVVVRALAMRWIDQRQERRDAFLDELHRDIARRRRDAKNDVQRTIDRLNRR